MALYHHPAMHLAEGSAAPRGEHQHEDVEGARRGLPKRQRGPPPQARPVGFHVQAAADLHTEGIYI